MDGLAALAATPGAAAEIHASMTSHGIESILLTTCNRVELYWCCRDPQDDVVAAGSLATAIGARPEDLTGPASWLAGEAAAHHLFRVCTGLESAVVGEAEVLGQARRALDTSRGARRFMVGVFRGAIRAGRAARAETAIGQGAVSVASTGIHWLSARVPLADCRVLIVGAGDTARKVARHLKAAGAGSLVIANRTAARAVELARGVSAEAVGLDALQDEILRADAIISAVNGSEWLITREHLRARHAGGRPLFIVDLSMPPSVEPVVAGGVERIDLGLLAEAADATRAQRSSEAPRVEAVIARELAWLRRWADREALRPSASGGTGATASRAGQAEA
jgi:glutamyl-tRNA reductase